MTKDIKIVTICGSMRYTDEMIKIAYDLEAKYGYAVIQCVYNMNNEKIGKNDIDNLANAHWKKIEISDAIYVVNVDGYIGESVSREIEYAKKLGKEIIYHVK